MKRAALLIFLLMSSCAPVAAATPDLFMQAQAARATADAAQDVAQFQGERLTASAEAPLIRITETAAGLIAQQTQRSIDLTNTAILWTATPSPTLTASPTMTISPTPTPNATSTMVFAILNAEGTQLANDVARDNLKLDGEKQTNEFKAIAPYLAFFVVPILLIALWAVWMSRRERYRAIPVDARGNPQPMLDTIDGVVFDVDSMPNYIGGIKREDTKLLPVITAERQDAVKQRDQLTDLATRGLPHDPGQRDRKKQAGQEAMKQLGAPAMAGRFKILDPTTTDLEVIDGHIIQELDQAWKESQE